MSERIEEVKSLLDKHSYLVYVLQSNDGCVVRFPNARIINNLGVFYGAYALDRDTDKPGVFFTSSFQQEEKFVSVPQYAMRLYVWSDIMKCCTRVPISDRLVTLMQRDGRVVEQFEEILHGPSRLEDQQREGFLTTLVMAGKTDGFPPAYEQVAEQHGVLEGYRLVRNFYLGD